MSSFLRTLKGFKKRSRGVRAIELINPPREWFVGLLLGASTFSLGALYLGYDFWEQYHMVDNEPIVDESVVRYHQSDAQYYIDIFRKRDATFQALRAEVHAPIAAPSIMPVVENEEEASEEVLENQEKPIAP